MNYAACGSIGCFNPTPLNKNALEIAFKLLRYHKDSARTLRFDEYARIRANCNIMSDDIHEQPLYIIEHEDFSILMMMDDNGDNLSRVCNLRWLFHEQEKNAIKWAESSDGQD